MPAVLPPALEALLRMEGRQYPNASEMEQIGMPIGVPFSNQNPGPGYRNVPDGRLSALTTMLSGLGAPMGFQPQPQAPDPRTLVMRSTMSPGDQTTPVGHGAALAPQGYEGDVAQEIVRRIGGQAPSQQDIWSRQAQYLKQGGGIGNPELYQQTVQRRNEDEAARRGVVNQRAMQVAQARTNRQSGMDPRTAALLAALGDDAGGMGGMVLADALLGRGAGLEMREQDQTAEANKRALDIKAREQGATAPAASGDAAAKGEAKIAEAIRGGDKAAVTSALTEEARALLADARKRGLSFRWQVDEVLNALQTKHGATLQQAQEALAAATGNDPGAFKNRTGKSDQRYKPGPGGITGEDIETTIGTPIINAWDAISGLFK